MIKLRKFSDDPQEVAWKRINDAVKPETDNGYKVFFYVVNTDNGKRAYRMRMPKTDTLEKVKDRFESKKYTGQGQAGILVLDNDKVGFTSIGSSGTRNPKKFEAYKFESKEQALNWWKNHVNPLKIN